MNNDKETTNNIGNNQGSSEVLISDTLQTNPEINDTSAGNLHATTDTLKQDSVETLNNVFPSESSEQVHNQDESLEILNKPNDNNVLNNTDTTNTISSSQVSEPTNPQVVAPTPQTNSVPESNVEVNPSLNNIMQQNNPTELKINPDAKIGELKPNKKSVIPVIIIFVVIIGCCFGLPYLYNAVNSYFTNAPSEPNNNQPTNPDDNPENNGDEEENNDGESEETELNLLTPETVINYHNLNFSNFSLITEDNSNFITYTVSNNSPSNVEINNLYVELYNDDKTLLGRAIIEAQNLAVGNNITLKSEITTDVKNNTTQILIIEKDEEDYPNVELVNNTLTCTKGINQIIYTFLNNKLTNINDIYNYVTTDITKYETDALEYKNKLNSYLTYGGITSFVENPSGFTASINLNLKDIDEEAINTNNNYYKYETSVNKIKFQQESKAYICQ